MLFWRWPVKKQSSSIELSIKFKRQSKNFQAHFTKVDRQLIALVKLSQVRPSPKKRMLLTKLTRTRKNKKVRRMIGMVLFMNVYRLTISPSTPDFYLLESDMNSITISYRHRHLHLLQPLNRRLALPLNYLRLTQNHRLQQRQMKLVLDQYVQSLLS